MKRKEASLALAIGMVLLIAGCARSDGTNIPAAGTVITPSTPATMTPTGSAATSPPVANSATPASDNTAAGVIGSDTVGSASLITGPAENTAAAGGGAGQAANASTGAKGSVPSGRAPVTGTTGQGQGAAR